MTGINALGWPTAIVLLAAAVATELLPVVFGTGSNARWDWGFTYVTMRFIVLPTACVLHLLVNVVAALVLSVRGTATLTILASLSSITISLAYLVSLGVRPVFLFLNN